MFPWIWIFAPVSYFPWSGAVDQAFTMDSFFRAMPAGAGVPEIEKQAFTQASYGRQLGWLTDVLLDAIDPATLPTDDARAALTNLKTLRAKIERMKLRHETAGALLGR